MASRSETGRVRTDPRISRRRRAVAKSKRRRVIASSIAVAVLGAAVWGAFWSPLLDVRRVQVVGARNSDVDDVRAAVALGSGDNLLLLSTGDVAADVEALPWVKSAEVDRRLPGTVRIRIEERRPAVVVTGASGSWTIDRTGVVLEEGGSRALPTLTGAMLSRPQPGQQIAIPEVRNALAVWRSLPAKVKRDVASVVAPAGERIAVALEDGTVVRYGGADRLAAKNEVLVALLERLDSEGRAATYVDVSSPSTPAIGPAPASAAPTPTPSF